MTWPGIPNKCKYADFFLFVGCWLLLTSFFLFLAVRQAVFLQRELQKGRRGVQKTQKSKVLPWECVYIKVEQLNKQPSAWFGGEKGSLQEWIGMLLACICRDMHIISGLYIVASVSLPLPLTILLSQSVPLRPKSVLSIIYYKILPWIINCSSEVIPFWKGAWGSLQNCTNHIIAHVILWNPRVSPSSRRKASPARDCEKNCPNWDEKTLSVKRNHLKWLGLLRFAGASRIFPQTVW